MLHTVNKSPFEKTSLSSCLRFAQSNDAILLYEDGVYAALKNGKFAALLADILVEKKLYVLEPDLNARGFKAEQVLEGIQLVDYAGFVDLTLAHSSVQAWL